MIKVLTDASNQIVAILREGHKADVVASDLQLKVFEKESDISLIETKEGLYLRESMLMYI